MIPSLAFRGAAPLNSFQKKKKEKNQRFTLKPIACRKWVRGGFPRPVISIKKMRARTRRATRVYRETRANIRA